MTHLRMNVYARSSTVEESSDNRLLVSQSPYHVLHSIVSNVKLRCYMPNRHSRPSMMRVSTFCLLHSVVAVLGRVLCSCYHLRSVSLNVARYIIHAINVVDNTRFAVIVLFTKNSVTRAGETVHHFVVVNCG
jgi:hypothetical protein